MLVNGQLPQLGTKITPSDTVSIQGKVISAVAADKSDRVYVLYHKPVGITCTTERHIKKAAKKARYAKSGLMSSGSKWLVNRN